MLSELIFEFFDYDNINDSCIVGDIMIMAEKEDLISRRDLYFHITDRMNKEDNGATLNSSLSLWQILEVLEEVPLKNELRAEWIQEDGLYLCSWCRIKASYKDGLGRVNLSRYCPSCGRRMKARA